MDRRQFLTMIGAAPVAAARPSAQDPFALRARPRPPTHAIAPGLHRLGLGGARDAALFVPASYSASTPAPLLVLLHGAGRASSDWTGATQLTRMLDARGILMLAPDSRGATWEYCDPRDVTFIDAALEWTFDRASVESARVALGGFSDGASFALSIGLYNGALFPSLLAFSPGFIASSARRGKPRVFISHGRSDAILPYGNARRIVTSLRAESYDVRFESFAGGHTIEPPIAAKALDWFQERAQDRP